MKAIEFLKKMETKKARKKGSFIPKENYLWYHLRDVIGDKKATIYFRPYNLEDAIAYYGEIGKNFRITPITEEEYNLIWEKINKERKIHGKQITKSPVIRFVFQIVLLKDFPENKIDEDKVMIVECSKTEFERLVTLEKNMLEGNFKDYFESIEKTPEEMGMVIKREYKEGDKVANYEYMIKITAKGIEPVTVKLDEKMLDTQAIDLARYYLPDVKKERQEELEIEEVVG